MNERETQLYRKIRAACPTRKFESHNRLRDSHLQQASRFYYCRFLATRSFNSFREHYDFPPGAVTELQNLLDSQFDKIPYGWGVYEIDAGIARIIETFIKDRKIQRIGHNHISI